MTFHAVLRASLTRAILVAALALSTLGAFAQTSERALLPGSAVVGQIDAANPAQVYTYTATSGDSISVGVTAEAGLALTLTLTDAAGNLLATATDTNSVGAVSVLNVTPADGLTYITVFPAAGLGTQTTGGFRIILETGGTDTTTAPAATPESPAATPETPVQPVTNVEYSVGSVLTSVGLQVSLSWASTADLNLELRDPTGQRLFFDNTSNTNGGTFGFDVNGLCEVLTGTNPTETATYAAGAIPTGYYEILVYYRQDCQNNGPQDFSLSVSVDGNTLEAVNGTLLSPTQGVFIGSFLVNTDGTAEMVAQRGLYGDVRSLQTSPAEVINATPVGTLSLDTPVRGTLAGETYFQTYKFTGSANDIVSISMTRTSGNLDTLLLVFDPNGIIIADNDDIVAGTVTDSAINNPPVRLPVDGEYTIMATRYGKLFGGTAGQYELLATAQTSSLPQDVIDLGLNQGDIQVALVWNTNHDLQLLIRDPSGIAIFDDRLSVPSGGQMTRQGNLNCVAPLTTPVSYIYWPPTLARGGNYEIEVWHQSDCADTRAVSATLYITVYGQTVGTIPITTRQNDRFVTSFTIDGNRNVSLGLGGITGGSETIDFSQELAVAPSLSFGQTVNGNITLENKFDVYTFEGTAGQVISINMIRTQGTSLDTKLFLISPSLFEVADNDDAAPGVTTDSAITRFTLPETGRYTILATHYGTIYGVTTGPYSLTLSQQ